MKPNLKVIDPEPLGKGVVTRLEYVLEEAKQGGMSSVAIVWIRRDGCSDWTYSDAPNLSTMLGAIDRMKHMLIVENEDA